MADYARMILSPREQAKIFGARCKPTSQQHIVKSRSEEPHCHTPWRWQVVARCGRTMRCAAIKESRPFLDLPMCANCRAA